jgi:RNA-directed DNA polymerase
VKGTASEGKPAGVATPTQAGEIWTRWPWVERSVWTDRMLAALETGVKGGKWFSLMDKVYSMKNLLAAWATVRKRKGAAGVDGQTVHRFDARAEQELARLEQELRGGTYVPKPVKRVQIPKPGSRETRPLGIPAVRDRVVQTAVRNVLEPIFEVRFAPTSYGFRPRRGCKDALRRVQQMLNAGHIWVVDADIRKYFDSIPHSTLVAEVEKEVADGRVIELLRTYLEARVLDGLEEWTPEDGTPQGAVISPLLANIYLHPVDLVMAAAGFEMVRYADDFVVMCRSQAEAEAALQLVRGLIEERGLSLHPEKTRIVDASQSGGFDFLGYHFERGYRWPREKSMKKLRDAIRAKTKRTNGNSLRTIIESINPTLRGWFGYFKHSHKFTFSGVDGWVRMRLRSILRKRRGRRGRGRGSDHQRWPNSFFREAGLYSMQEARTLLCRSQ